MTPRENKLVTDFLIRQASTDLLEGLNALSSMKFPVPDRLSFEGALEPQATDDRYKQQLLLAFGAQDFPILSPQSAFEKYHAKLRLPAPIPALSLPPLDLPDFSERPSPCEVYDMTFGRGLAADCACRAFGEAIREGFNSLQATIIGHFAGRRAARTRRCDG
jgi:hypothetical protein